LFVYLIWFYHISIWFWWSLILHFEWIFLRKKCLFCDCALHITPKKSSWHVKLIWRVEDVYVHIIFLEPNILVIIILLLNHSLILNFRFKMCMYQSEKECIESYTSINGLTSYLTNQFYKIKLNLKSTY